MQSLHELKRRIAASKETQKITRAMKLIAAARLRKAEIAALRGRDYAIEMHRSIQRISRHLGQRAPEMWRRPPEIKSFDTIVLTSDRGFCGSFNEDVNRFVDDHTYEHIAHNIEMSLYIVGNKGWNYFKRSDYDIERVPRFSSVEKRVRWLVNIIMLKYLGGDSSGSYICFNRYVSATKRELAVWNLLPLYAQGGIEEKSIEYQFEPERDLALDFFGSEMLIATVRQAIYESEAAELSARILAMTGATKNAEDMIDHLTGLYNRARQEAITSELMDVVGGAEAIGLETL